MAETDLVTLPLLAVMVNPSLVLLALLEAVTVRVEDQFPPVRLDGEKDQDSPVLSPVTDRLTGELNPFCGETETTKVVDPGRVTVLVDGLTLSVKVGAGGGLTISVAVASCVRPPPDVVSVIVYVPVGVADVVVTLKLPLTPGVTVGPAGVTVTEP